MNTLRRQPPFRRRFLEVLALGSAAVVLSAACAVALAQSAPAASDAQQNASGSSDTDTLQTVTVTAQFRKQNLQTTPLAITAISGEMLTARGQTNLFQVAAEAPNVVLEPTGAGEGDSMRAQIRGVGQTDLDPAVDPGVGIYIDDVYFATLMASDFALLDLDRVEILRGPQGTLSGMDSLGGSVKLYTKKANGDNDGYLEATYGSLGQIDVRGMGDVTLVPSTLFFRLSAVARREDGYVKLFDYACTHPDDPDVISGAIPRGNSTPTCQTGTEGGVNYQGLRGSLRWLPTSGVEVNWTTDVASADDGSTANTLLGTVSSTGAPQAQTFAWTTMPYDSRYVPPNPYANYANFLDPGVTYRATSTCGLNILPGCPASVAGAPNGAFYANPDNVTTSYGSSVTVDWQIAPKYSLKSITAYRHYDSSFGDDNSDSPVPLVLEEANFSHRQFSEELRLNGSLGSLMDFTVGGIYFDQRTIYASREDDPFVPYGNYNASFVFTTPIFDFLQDDPTVVRTHAGFFNTAWHLTHALTLNAGLRYTDEHKTYTFERLNIDGITPFLPLSNPADPLNGKVGVFDGSHVDYRLDLDYQWTPAVMTYAEFSTGFKGGGITPRPYFPEQVVPFGPETLKSYEIGLKSQWFENRLRANLAAFDERYYGYQAFATPATCVDAEGHPLPAPYNNPCGEYLNAANATGKGIEAEFNYLPTDTVMIDSSVSYLDFRFTRSLSPSVPVGSGVPDVGMFRASLGVQDELELGGHGSLTPRLDASFTPRSCGDVTCDADVENAPYTLINGRLTYWTPNRVWSVALEITNLTNKLYYITKTNTGAGYLDGQIGMPREWSITLHRQF
jgi:iron complex outermembrane recepter protein